MKGNWKGMKWNMKVKHESKWKEVKANDRKMKGTWKGIRRNMLGPLFVLYTGFHWVLYYACFVLMSRLYGYYKSIWKYNSQS